LRSFVEAHGDGDQGETVEREGETLERLPEPHDKRYLSIFGELLIGRTVYGTREGQAMDGRPWMRPWGCRPETTRMCWRTGSSGCAFTRPMGRVWIPCGRGWGRR